MKLQVGKTYLSSNGRKATVVKINIYNNDYIVEFENNSGPYYAEENGRIPGVRELDLIKEILNPIEVLEQFLKE